MTTKPTYAELEQRVETLEKEIIDVAQLEEQLRLLSLAVEQSSEGIAISDLEGNLKYINNAFAEMHGYSAEELMGTSLSIFHTPEQMPSVEAANLKLKQTGSFKGEIWHARRDGDVFPTLMHNSLIKDETNTPIGIMGTLRDISDMKETEEVKVQSSERYQKLAEATFDGIVVMDKGIILEVNSAFAAMFGYEPFELIGRDAIDVVASESRDVVRQNIMSDYEKPYEALALRKDSSTFYVEVCGTKVNLGHRMVRMTAIHDITERKEAEEKIKKSEARFRALFESTTSCMLVVENRVMTDVNQAALNTFGYTADEMIGKDTSLIHISRESYEESGKMAYESIQNKGYWHAELPFKKKNGETIWMSVYLSALPERGIVAVLHDITARKRAELALKESESRFRSIIEDSQDGIIFFDGQTLKILFGNSAMAGLLGCSEEDLAGRTISSLHPSEEWASIEQEFQRHLTREVSFSTEIPVIRHDGSVFYADISSGLTTLEGRPYFSAFFRDITERKQAEEELRRHREHLEELVEDRTAELERINEQLQVEITEHKEAEEGLRLFKAVVESSQEAIAISDRNGQLVYINRAHEKLFGRSLEEASRLNYREYYPPESVRLLDEVVAPALARGESWEGELEVFDANGHRFSLWERADSIRDANGEMLFGFGFMHDITERKRAEEELRRHRDHLKELVEERTTELECANEQLRHDIAERKQVETALKESEERLRRFSDAAFEAIIIHEEGILIRANDQYYEMFGYEPEELMGKQSIPLTIAPEAIESARKEIATGGLGPYESIGLKKDGTKFPVEIRVREWEYEGRKVRVAAIMDITERKQAEAKIRESEEKYRLLFDTTEFLLSVYDREGLCQLMNRRVATLFGGEPKDFIGRSIIELHPKDGRDYLRLFHETIDSGITQEREDEVVFPQGNRWLLTRLQPLPDAQGVFRTVQIISQDITERKQAEEVLRENAEYHRIITNTSMEGFVVTNSSGKFLDVNEVFCQMQGYSRDELLKMSVADIEAIETPDEIREHIKEITEIGSGRFETRHRRKDGRIIDIEVSMTAIQQKDLQLSFVRDITDRKRAEVALRSEREQLLSIFDSIGEIIYVSDPDTYEILYANKALKDAFQKDLIGGICYREFQGFDAPCRFCTNDIIRKQKYAPYGWEYHNTVLNRDYAITDRIIKWPDGRDVRFELAIDITERKRAEEMLQRYNQRLMILHQIDRDIVLARFPKEIVNVVLKHIRGLIPCWAAFVALYEHDTNEIIILAREVNGNTIIQPGMRIPMPAGWMTRMLTEKCYLVEDTHALPEPISQAVRLAIDEGVRSYLTASLVVEGNLIGGLILSSRTPSAFSDEDMEIAGEVADQLAVAFHQARLKEQIERHAAELEEKVAQRTAELQAINAELQAFAYSVSHDLKAPLRGIDGYSRLLLRDYADKLDEEGQTFLHTIRSASQQMSQLIDDLLAYSRLERRAMRTGKLNPQSLVEMVIAERANELQERQVTLSVDFPCETVTAEAEGLIVALRNLLENALKFSRDVPAPCIEIGGRETDKTCILWVRDNGIGFDMEYQDRIFQIFQRLHRAEDYPGTGIGLAIVRRVMQRMGGRVWGDSMPGRGATFYLEVPK